MHMFSLQSGSNGNCVYVEADGVRLLIDAGISGVQAQRTLAAQGIDIKTCDAVLISHDHSDHVKSAGIFQRKFGLPVYITAKTLAAACAYRNLGDIADIRHFDAGQTLRFGPVAVETTPTPHDGADGVAFIVDDGHRRLGIFTDLGHCFNGLCEAIASLDGVLLESNYDPCMLRHGDYPPWLKRRIEGPGGHLSNNEAARLLVEARSRQRLRWACIGHLSQENNTPDLAMIAHQELLGESFPIHLASRYGPSEMLEVA